MRRTALVDPVGQGGQDFGWFADEVLVDEDKGLFSGDSREDLPCGKGTNKHAGLGQEDEELTSADLGCPPLQCHKILIDGVRGGGGGTEASVCIILRFLSVRQPGCRAGLR